MANADLEDLEKDLKRMSELAPKEYDKLMKNVSEKILENAAEVIKPNSKSGRMLASYEKRPFGKYKEWVDRRIDKDTVEAGTKVFYARWVEEGHTIGKKKKRRKRKQKATGKKTEAKKYFETAFNKTTEELKPMVEKFMDEVFGRVLK